MPLSAAFQPGAVAVVTGAASGIGLAAAHAFAALGLKICLVDLPGEKLAAAERDLASRVGAENIYVRSADVSDFAQMKTLELDVRAHWGEVAVLMNNAAIQPGSAMFDARDAWEKVIAVNLWGVINGTQAFVPGMMTHGQPGVIINTGSKQGITTPPGDPAYNVAKAGVKAFTEALAHDLRNQPGGKLAAHLLIPGFVYTGLTSRGRPEKPAAAWTAEQTVEFMMASLARGDFYILCPDNDVSRALDEKRIAWAAGDIIENRPPLSRWHADYKDAFAEYLKK